MNTEKTDVVDQAAPLLQEALARLPGLSVTLRRDVKTASEQLDVLADVHWRGQDFLIAGEAKRSGEPALARAAIFQLREFQRQRPGTVTLFIAPYLSPRTADLCRQEGTSYLDLAGNCHLEFDGVYIHVEGKPNPFAQARGLRSLYQPKAERVLRVLVSDGPRPWRLQALADEAGVSVGQVYKVKEGLREKEWLAEGEQGVTLTQPGALLDAWAQEYRPRRHARTDLFTLEDLDEFGRRLGGSCRALGIPCALTSFAAAQWYAPHAAFRRLTAYVGGEVEALTNALDLSPVDRGANVTLLVPYDGGVFADVRERQGRPLAVPAQVWLDLQHEGARGREAAEVLKEQEILPLWQEHGANMPPPPPARR